MTASVLKQDPNTCVCVHVWMYVKHLLKVSTSDVSLHFIGCRTHCCTASPRASILQPIIILSQTKQKNKNKYQEHLDGFCLFVSVVLLLFFFFFLIQTQQQQWRWLPFYVEISSQRQPLWNLQISAGSFHFKITENLLLWPRNLSGQEHRLMNTSFWLTTKVGGKNSYYVFSLCTTCNRTYICKLTPRTHLFTGLWLQELGNRSMQPILMQVNTNKSRLFTGLWLQEPVERGHQTDNLYN